MFNASESRTNSEDGMKAADMDVPQTGPGQPPVNTEVSAARRAVGERVANVIELALQARLPRDRELLPGELIALKPIHMQMVLDQCSGLMVVEIAEKYGYTPERTGVILRHPDALTLKAVVMGGVADNLTDMGERLKHLAPEALNVKVEILRTSADNRLRDKIASDILDRAGYAPKRQVDVAIDTKHTFVMPAQAATRLTEVMEESNRVAVADYSKHLSNPRVGEAAASSSTASLNDDGAGPSGAQVELASPLAPSEDQSARQTREAMEEEKELIDSHTSFLRRIA